MFTNLTFIRNNYSKLKISSKVVEVFNPQVDFLDIEKLVNCEVSDSECENLIILFRVLNDTESYKSPITVDEVKECIDNVKKSTIYLLEKHPWLYIDIKSMTLEDFWRKADIKYDVVLSAMHLLLLINYYEYISCDTYFEKSYGGDDKYIDSLKMKWDEEVKNRMHFCDICENLVESESTKKIKIKVIYEK